MVEAKRGHVHGQALSWNMINNRDSRRKKPKPAPPTAVSSPRRGSRGEDTAVMIFKDLFKAEPSDGEESSKPPSRHG